MSDGKSASPDAPRYVNKYWTQRILQLYRYHKNGHEVAKRVPYTAATVYSVLRRCGVTPYGPRSRASIPVFRWGKVARAYYSHEGTITRWVDFAREHDLHPNAVSMFLKRTKADIKAVLNETPVLNGVRALLADYQGISYRVSDFEHFTYLIDKYLLHVALRAIDFSGNAKYFPIYDLPAFRTSVQKWYTTEGRERGEAVTPIEMVKSIADLASLPDGSGIKTAPEFASGLLPAIPGIEALKQVNKKIEGRTAGEQGGHTGDEVGVAHPEGGEHGA